MGQDFVGYAAEQNSRNPAAPMRSHDDEVATLLLGRRANSSIGLIALELRRLTGNARRLRLVGDMVQYSGGVFSYLLRMLGERFRHLAQSRFRHVVDAERSFDDERGHLAPG